MAPETMSLITLFISGLIIGWMAVERLTWEKQSFVMRFSKAEEEWGGFSPPDLLTIQPLATPYFPLAALLWGS